MPAPIVLYLAGGALVAGAAFYFAISKKTSRKGVPDKMRAVRVTTPVTDKTQDMKGNFEVATVDTPKPRNGQVLVRMERAPINPSDLGPVWGRGKGEPLPAQLGLEGCGTVVQSGGGFFGWRVLGKRVACISSSKGVTWAEYALVPALTCLPIPKQVTWDEAASCFVNPLTAVSFIDIAKQNRQRYFVHTAAASALGRMLIRLGRRNGISVICLVRKDSNKADLVKNEQVPEGDVIVTTDEKVWVPQLKEMCKTRNIRLAFDAIAGEMSGTLCSNMPDDTKVFVYGVLSGRDISGVRPLDIMYQGKSVQGFYLGRYMKTRSLMQQKKMTDTVVARLQDDLRSPIAARFPLESAHVALHQYLNNMGDGKVLLSPTLPSNAPSTATPSSTAPTTEKK